MTASDFRTIWFLIGVVFMGEGTAMLLAGWGAMVYGFACCAASMYWAVATNATSRACEHQWVDARNSAVESGEVCLRCGAVRAGNATSRAEEADRG